MYQPIDFYALAAKKVSKSIVETTLKIDQIEGELNAYAPKEQSLWLGRKITVIRSGISGSANARNKDSAADKIEKIQIIQRSIQSLAEEFKQSVKGFQTTLAAEILPVDEKIKKLNALCESHLAKYHEILNSQNRFS
ncbi:hypothetical protein [Candidatus Protochlamydia phocaeensis]|uniref:hypothetical protein n=1 Tax=Candidatus Protochlamydia phocaeensis TaxID=1414722 RepID=UPI0008396EE4|nr:hypothetical protein [Candidatus Protochlamydia phocaeensis]